MQIHLSTGGYPHSLPIDPGGSVQHGAQAAAPCRRIDSGWDIRFCKAEEHHEYGKDGHSRRSYKSSK